MSTIDETNIRFEEIDRNRDGNIDKYEFRKWMSNAERVPASTYETSSSEVYRNGHGANRFDQNRYETSASEIYRNDHSANRFDQNRYETSTSSEIYLNDNNTSRLGRNKYVSYGASDVSNETVIETNGLEETNGYLERAVNIYKDPDPVIIRRPTTANPITYQQRILVRYLQPPDAPAPGPLIIKEVRAPQLPPPPLLAIRQYAKRSSSPPPLILRERPPTPPPIIPSETITRQLPALPPPPRSVVIERFPPEPDKPRDIIIERWLPYGPPPERRTITEEASAAIAYSEPRNKIIIYENVDPRIVRQFEKDGVVREDPANYVARYGDSLLDSATLMQLARNAGVFEDLSPPAISHSSIRESTIDYALTGGSRFQQDKQYISSKSSRRQGTFFDFVQYGLFPADYTPGMKFSRKFVRPANFSFPPSSMWSIKIAKYREELADGRIISVTVELVENGIIVYSRTLTEKEYKKANVSSTAPKLAWNDFLQVLQVFMLGNNQERESDIARAFNILDQSKRGLYGRTVSLSDGLISPDELRAFLSIFTDEYRVDLCVFLADTNGSGQISLSEFNRMVKSGLARDIICESM